MDSSLNKSAEELDLLLEKISREGIEKQDIKTKLSSVLAHQAFRTFIFIFLVIMLFLTSLYIAYLKNQNEKLEKQLKKALNNIPEAQVLLPNTNGSSVKKDSLNFETK